MSKVETVEKLTPLRRFVENAEIRIERQDEDDVVRLTFPASSETPVDRFYGKEVLSHKKGAVRLQRAKSGAMPLLFNHNMNDPIGVIDGARIEDNRMVVDAHLFNTARAAEVARMIEGGLRNVSIMYRSYKIEEDEERETFTVKDWEPFEVSIVTVPADASVGIGRSPGEEYEARILRVSKQQTAAAVKEKSVEKETEGQAAAAGSGSGGNTEVKETKTVEVRAGTQYEQPNAVELEKARKRAIENLCKANNLDDKYRDYWIGTGVSIEEVSEDILRILEERGKENPKPASAIGLSQQEAQQFSLRKAILAVIDKDWNKAQFELECSRAVADKLGKVNEPTKFYVPFEVLQRPVDLQQLGAQRALEALGLGRRDLTVGTAGAGGFLVATDNVGFIEILRNRSVAFRMGARRLSGLQGNVTIPRQSAAATAYWLSTESTQITESQQTFVQLALSPKTVGAYTEISRLLLMQSSPSAEAIVTDDLAQVVALAADLAVLNGSGAGGEPTGILQTGGIGSVTGTDLQYAGVLEFQVDVAEANVTPARGGYVTTPAVAALLMQRVAFANTASPLWVGNIWDGNVVGFPAMSSNQMPAATMLFGDWPEVVVGEWGVLEVEVNPFANFQAGIIGVRAMYSLDVGVRRPFAFSAASSIT